MTSTDPSQASADRYVVIGNPVAHSRSPAIHAAFARQTGEAVQYDRLEAPLDGFADTVRQFLDAGLVDTLHVAVAPVELGAGSRLWDSPDDLLDRYHRDVVPSPSGVVHHLFWRD